MTCLYPTYMRGEAYLAEGQGRRRRRSSRRSSTIVDMVWNCATGALANLGVARAYAQEAKSASGADADTARVRALAAYKDFLTLWKDADAGIPVYHSGEGGVCESAAVGPSHARHLIE